MFATTLALEVPHRVIVNSTVLSTHRPTHPVCVVHVKLIFFSVYTQHNQCPCLCVLERQPLWSQTTRQGYTRHIQQKVVWPCNANRNEHEGQRYASQYVHLTPDYLQERKTKNEKERNKQGNKQLERKRETGRHEKNGNKATTTSQQLLIATKTAVIVTFSTTLPRDVRKSSIQPFFPRVDNQHTYYSVRAGS